MSQQRIGRSGDKMGPMGAYGHDVERLSCTSGDRFRSRWRARVTRLQTGHRSPSDRLFGRGIAGASNRLLLGAGGVGTRPEVELGAAEHEGYELSPAQADATAVNRMAPAGVKAMECIP